MSHCEEATVGCKSYTVGTYMGSLDGWVPVDLLFVGIDLVAVAVLLHVTAKVVRLVASLLTGGGGAN